MATQEKISAAEADLQMSAQKRSAAEAAEPLLFEIQAIVLDVEGTTIPGSYLKNLLTFESLQKYLKDTVEEPETIKDLAALRELSQKEKDDGVEGAEPIPATADKAEEMEKAVTNNTLRWLDNKPDCAEFKQFRDHVLRHSFGLGCDKFKAELFEDVVPMLRMLSEEGYNLYIFSSESEEYYKMLFNNTSQGDIVDVFTRIFDTATMGPKTEPSSYTKISAEIKIPGKNILYLTDTPEEADAARMGGWRSALVIRPGNPDLTDEHLQNFACIEQLDELYGEDDDEDVKRFHGDDNGEADDDEDEEENDDEVDEEDEGEEDDGEGEDA